MYGNVMTHWKCSWNKMPPRELCLGRPSPPPRMPCCGHTWPTPCQMYTLSTFSLTTPAWPHSSNQYTRNIFWTFPPLQPPPRMEHVPRLRLWVIIAFYFRSNRAATTITTHLLALTTQRPSNSCNPFALI